MCMAVNFNNYEDVESRLKKLSYYCGHHELKELKNKIDSKLKDLKEQPVYIMIVGDGKRGKSTLLNALIGQNLAEVNFLPKTWRIDTYTTNDEEYAELVWEKNGQERKEKTTFEKAFALCRDIESKQKQVTRNIEEWKSDLKQINWYVKTRWNLRGRALVDTPGFSQLRADTSIKAQTLYNASGIQVQREDGFSYYYYRADLVLWYIHASKLEDADALDKLKEVHSQNKQIIGIITYMDRIPKERWEDIKKRAEKVYGNYIKRFIFSAAGAKDETLKRQTIREIRAAVDEYTLGKEKLIKHKEAEKFYNHNLNELENIIRQIAALFTDNYIQYHNLYNSTKESLSTHEDNAREKISSNLEHKRKSLLNSLENIWLTSREQPNVFAEEIKNRIPINQCNSEFEKIYGQLADNLYAVFRIAESTDYKAVKLGQNKVVPIKLDNLNTGNLILHNESTINIDRFNSLRGKAAGEAAKEFFGDNIVGEIFEKLGKLISSGRIKREKIGGAEKYINEIFDDLSAQYSEYIEKLSKEYSGKIKTYIENKFKIVNGGKHKSVLNRIYDIENTLNNLNLYGDVEAVVYNKTLIKSSYIYKIIYSCRNYFPTYFKEQMDFLDYHLEKLYKHNKEKISAVFNRIVIDIEEEPLTLNFGRLLNIPNIQNKIDKEFSSVVSIIDGSNPNDSWRQNIYWAENNLSLISKLNLLTTDHISHVQKRYKEIVKSLLKSYNEFYNYYSNEWDNDVRKVLDTRLKDYEKKLQLNNRIDELRNSVYTSLRKDINYHNIDNFFSFEAERVYCYYFFNSIDYSFFYNSRGQFYKFYDGKDTKDYIRSKLLKIVERHWDKVLSLEKEYEEELYQRQLDYLEVKFDEYLDKSNIVDRDNKDIEEFKNKLKELSDAQLTLYNKELFEQAYREVVSKYNVFRNLDYSFFYPESVKENKYFRTEKINYYIRALLNEIIENKKDEINSYYEKATKKWDKRVLDYSREYYSKLIVENIRNNNKIFDSKIIKDNFFEVIKTQYSIGHYEVVGRVNKKINFRASMINAIDFKTILKENPLHYNLTFNLNIRKEIKERYKIFERNMITYMDDQLYLLCKLFFKERKSIKFKLFKGRNSVFVAKTLNEIFRSYILEKDGVLL